MIISLIEMLELPNFGPHLQYILSHLIISGDVMDINYNFISFILKQIFLKRPRVANFAVIIQIATIFIKRSLNTQTKLKGLEIMY